MVLAIGLSTIGTRQWELMSRDSFVFKEEENEVSLIVRTLSPEKWLLIDRETGQTYQGNPGGFWDKLKTIKRSKE